MTAGFHLKMPGKWRTRLKKALGKYIIVQNLFDTSFVKVIEKNKASKYLGPLGGETILDIACGSGLFAFSLARKHCQVYGVDSSVDRIEMAKSLVQGHNCHFAVGDAENLPFKSGTFDKVVSVCSLEHFDDDERALAEMNRVLKDDGVLVLTVDSFTYTGINKHIQEKHRKENRVVNYYSDSQVREKLQKHGFSVDKTEYFVSSPVASFFYTLGIKLKFGYLFKFTFPLAYPSSLISDKFFGRREEGYRLAAKARKIKK